MNTFKRILAACMVLFTISSCKNSKKDHPTEKSVKTEVSDKTHITPLFENDYTKVAKVILEPGQEQQLHQGGARVIYSLNDYTIAWEENGDNLGQKEWKKGDVHSHQPGTHKAKNTGSKTAEWLVFGRTQKELPPCENYDSGEDVNSIKPDAASVLLDNENFKAMQVTLNSGDSIPNHNGINRIIYALSDYSLEYTSDKTGTVNKDFRAGDVHWHGACKHSLKNTGASDAKFLVLVYKK